MDPTTALIYVEALELGNFLPAFMTNTVVTSGSVDACRGAWTFINSFSAFVNIKTYRMCRISLSSPSYVTTAVKSSRIIDARSLWVADIWVFAFVSIVTRPAIERPSYERRALTSVGPWCVDTSGWWQTVVRTKETLVSVPAGCKTIIPLVS